MDADDRILLVIPCYQESARVTSLLQGLKTALDKGPPTRVLLVDDGSGPGEADLLRARLRECAVDWEVHALPANVGKGGTVYAGWSQHRGEKWLAFVDADGSCSGAEVARLLAMRGAGAIFASRIMMLGRSVKRDWHRHLLGRIFATLVGTLLRVPVYDSQCGLKIVPRAAYEKVKPELKITGFGFDVDLLCALLDSGCVVREEPIDWHETPGGKVRLLRDSWRMLREVLDIRAQRRIRQNALDSQAQGP